MDYAQFVFWLFNFFIIALDLKVIIPFFVSAMRTYKGANTKWSKPLHTNTGPV